MATTPFGSFRESRSNSTVRLDQQQTPAQKLRERNESGDVFAHRTYGVELRIRAGRTSVAYVSERYACRTLPTGSCEHVFRAAPNGWRSISLISWRTHYAVR